METRIAAIAILVEEPESVVYTKPVKKTVVR